MHAIADQYANTSGDNTAAIILVILGIIAYWTPTMVAWIRKVPNAGSVTAINFFAGWTFVGWVVALAMACRSHPQQVTVQYPYGMPPQFPPNLPSPQQRP